METRGGGADIQSCERDEEAREGGKVAEERRGVTCSPEPEWASDRAEL